MSIETYQFNLPITPGAIPPVLHLSQYDSGRTFTAILRDDANVPFELDSGATAVIKGRNAAGIAWQQDCTVSGANVTFTPSGAATDQHGIMPVTIEITESEEVISPLCVIFNIQKAGYTNEEAVLSPDFETAIQAAVAQAIAEGGLGFSDEFKESLLACFEQVAWKTTYGQTYLSALETALYPEVHLASINAAYDQDRPIYDTDSLDLVKLDLVVTANYSDGTSEVVTDYTLSGTLTPGTSTITVSYGGKTAEIEVAVTAAVPSGYTRYDYIKRSGATGSWSAPAAAWIQLGTIQNINQYSVEFWYKAAAGHTDGAAIWGGRVSSPASNTFSFYANTNALTINAHGWAGTAIPAADDVVHHVNYVNAATSPSSASVDDGSPVDVVWKNTDDLTLSPTILTNYTEGGTSSGVAMYIEQGRIIFRNMAGTKTGDFIPVVRDADNVIGVWDVVSQTFHTASTTSYATIGNSSQRYSVGNWS